MVQVECKCISKEHRKFALQISEGQLCCFRASQTLNILSFKATKLRQGLHVPLCRDGKELYLPLAYPRNSKTPKK